jgi:hypothetical protein
MNFVPDLSSQMRDAAFQLRRVPLGSEMKFDGSIYIVNDSLYNLYFFGSHKSHASSRGSTLRRVQVRDIFVGLMREQNKNVITSGSAFDPAYWCIFLLVSLAPRL